MMKYIAQGAIVLSGGYYMVMEHFIIGKPEPIDATMLWAAAGLIIVALGVFDS